MPRVLMLLTSHGWLGDSGERTGFHLGEAAVPWQLFREAGHEVDVASPAGGMPPFVRYDQTNGTHRSFLSLLEAQGTRAACDVQPAYDAVFCAGGHGAMWDFPYDEGVQALLHQVHERGGYVAAVCHGVAALVPLGDDGDGNRLVAGREVTGFTNAEEVAAAKDKIVPFLLEDQLRRAGAQFSCGEPFASHIAIDGPLITGQNPASAAPAARALLEHLGSVPSP